MHATKVASARSSPWSGSDPVGVGQHPSALEHRRRRPDGGRIPLEPRLGRDRRRRSRRTPRRRDRRRRVERQRVGVAPPCQRSQRAARVAVQVGVDDGADRERVVEALLVGGERQQHRPAGPTRYRAASRRRTSMRSSRCVAAPGHEPLVGVGHHRRARRRAGPANRTRSRPRRRAGRAGSPSRRPAWAIRWSNPSSASTSACQSGPAADEAGEPADPVGECPGASVDQAGSELIPGRVAGERRVGEPGAQPVLEPPVELDAGPPSCGRPVRPSAVELVTIGRPGGRARRQRRRPATGSAQSDGRRTRWRCARAPNARAVATLDP